MRLTTEHDVQELFRRHRALPVHVYAILPVSIRDGKWMHALAQVRDNGRIGFPGGRAGVFPSMPSYHELEASMSGELFEEHGVSFAHVSSKLAAAGATFTVRWALVEQGVGHWHDRHLIVYYHWTPPVTGTGYPPFGLDLSHLLLRTAGAKDLGSEVLGVLAVPFGPPPSHVEKYRGKAFRNTTHHVWEFPHRELLAGCRS